METDPISTTPQNAGSVSDVPTKGHEDSDVDPLGVTLFGFGLAAMLVAVLVASILMFRIFGRIDDKVSDARKRQEPGAASLVRARPDYSGPLLQVLPEEDLKAMRANNDGDLNNYSMADPSVGTIRIPIERAMDLLVQRGLPPTSPVVTLEELQRQRNQPDVYRQNLAP